MPGARRSSQFSDLWRSIFEAASPESTTRPLTMVPSPPRFDANRFARLEVERDRLARA